MGLMQRLLNYQINSRADAGCLSPSPLFLSSLTAPDPPPCTFLTITLALKHLNVTIQGM